MTTVSNLYSILRMTTVSNLYSILRMTTVSNLYSVLRMTTVSNLYSILRMTTEVTLPVPLPPKDSARTDDRRLWVGNLDSRLREACMKEIKKNQLLLFLVAAKQILLQ
nr:uncharacterized protein LOC128698266 [Cherax quadricarinatus]